MCRSYIQYTHTYHAHTLNTQLDEGLFAFLLSHNNQDEGLAIEDGYNLKESVSRFAHESHVHLFGQVISGKLSESVFHRWLTTQKAFTEACNDLQVEKVSDVW